MSRAEGTVITVLRGAIEVVQGDRLQRLRLSGANAHRELALAVGDRVTFDPVRGALVDVLPRRTQLARLRTFGKPRPQVIAANVDRLAIVTSVANPPFKSGAVDRFLLAAHAGGLEAVLVVNKLDLLGAEAVLDEEIRAYEGIVPVFAVSAARGSGLETLRSALARSTTVFAGHSGVGKSSLLNALEPELRLETGEVSAKWDRGRHTTSRAAYLRLAGDAVVIDTPGVREIGTGPVDPDLLGLVYPDIALLAAGCRFRDCRHGAEPGCAVRLAVQEKRLRPARLASYQRLLAEASA
ncbi:MAG TPA: ribosome small subunit-dependent GTPase A [Myxococcota bacterium]|nr:ribosome small subunit-dependent GTPase A [Myxococcota bacterium]